MIRPHRKSLPLRLGTILLAGMGILLALGVAWKGVHLELGLRERLQSPSVRHVLGTDALGRDILSCLAFGTLVSLAIALAVVAAAAAVGSGLGFLAGWHEGWIGIAIMRVADFVLAFPGLLLALALVAVWGPGIANLVLALAASGWVGYARLVRGEVLRIKRQDFIHAARGFNASSRHIAGRHMLPLIMPMLLTHAVSGLAAVILAEASLNFLGLGLDPRLPTLGGMIDAGRGHLLDRPAQVLLPGICLTLLVAGFLLVAEGLVLRPAGDAFEKTGE
jgi:peptide/nickel transport system permease protein